MNKMLGDARWVYQTVGDLKVTNIFGQERTDHISWLVAFGRCVNESIVAFGERLNVIYMNNAWGTFDDPRKVKNLDDIIHLVSDRHYNPEVLRDTVTESAKYMECRNCCLHMLSGLDAICRATPVISQGTIIGIILAAWKQDSTTAPKKATSTLRIVE